MKKSPLTVIDAHAHCGVIDLSFAQSFADYRAQVAGTDIGGVALFSPVLEIYDRYDFHFTDTPAWRRRRRQSNAGLLALKAADLSVFPYFFIWNDFAVEQLSPARKRRCWAPILFAVNHFAVAAVASVGADRAGAEGCRAQDSRSAAENFPRRDMTFQVMGASDNQPFLFDGLNGMFPWPAAFFNEITRREQVDAHCRGRWMSSRKW